MTVTVYRSTDTSAPVLTGQVGSLISLLDAILVNGYGSKASQGWTKPFTGTNAASYLMKSGTNQRYLDVADNGVGAANYARLVAYEAMTALATGTNPFPSAAQFAGGLYCVKSTTADAAARPWMCVANGAFFWLFCFTDSGATVPATCTVGFGDVTTYVPSDVYNTILIAGTTTTAAATSIANHQLVFAGGFGGSLTLGHYVCRNYTGVGTSATLSKFTNGSLGGYLTSGLYGLGSTANVSGGVIGGVALPYPNPADAGIYLERLWAVDTQLRGELPGLWAPLQPGTGLVLGDTFSGTGALSGKTFEVIRSTIASGAIYAYIETSNTW